MEADSDRGSQGRKGGKRTFLTLFRSSSGSRAAVWRFARGASLLVVPSFRSTNGDPAAAWSRKPRQGCPGSAFWMTALTANLKVFNTHYGLGVHVAHAGGQLIVEHGGNVMGFASDNLMLPQSGAAVVVLTNSYEAPASRIARRVAQVLVPALARARPSVAGVAPRADAAAQAAVARIRWLLGKLANGTVPRPAITPDFAYLLKARNRVRAQESLHRLGAVLQVTWLGTEPRGGLSVTAARVRFAHGSATAALYETPANRTAELMLFP